MTSLKSILATVFFLTAVFIFGQAQQKSQELLNATKKEIYHDHQKALKFAEEAIEEGRKTGDSKTIAYAYLYMSRIYAHFNTKMSLQCLDLAQKEQYTATDPVLQAEIQAMKTYNYSFLGLGELTMDENLKEVRILEKKFSHNKKMADILISKYFNIAQGYYYQKNYKKAQEYIDKALSTTDDISKDYLYVHRVSSCYQIKAAIYLALGEQDSALANLNKVSSISRTDPNNTRQFEYQVFASYYELHKNVPEELRYNLMAVDEIDKHHINDIFHKRELYGKIADNYKKLGDAKNEQIYRDKYKEENTAIEQNLKDTMLFLVSTNADVLKENNKKWYTEREFLTSLIILAFMLPVSGYGIWYFTKRKARKKHESSGTESKTSDETRAVSSEDMNKVMEMAKNNDPQFLLSFLNLYPEFQENLLKQDESLKNSEITLLAYVFLNFSTKEIASSIYRSEKTINNRKYNLRKKLNIPTQMEIGTWLRQNIVK